ncbi:MAG: Asp23/Gls24 family envelope stress response protein [Anaerovoracaceae bacterium]|nr:Asp23/Gls24 family envelope stress response protein [Anaerovoracaceae bacterium]
MFRNTDTEYGSIGINKSIITQMVTDAVDAYSGKARLGNAKAVFNIFSNDESSNIDIVWDDEEIYINIFLIIKFGTSISRVTNGIIDYIEKNIKVTFGDIPHKIRILVTGIESKQQVIKRDIEVVR